ncbi:hypothetical protein [Streptomyces sp. SYSU K21746]
MTEPAHLAAVRESHDAVAADYAGCVKPPAGSSQTWGAGPAA